MYKLGHVQFSSYLQSCFKTNCAFYSRNSSLISLDINPFGIIDYSDMNEFEEWISDIQVGQIIDVLKNDMDSTTKSWTRGRIIRIQEDKIHVSLLRVEDQNLSIISLKKTPYNIQSLGKRSTSWEWRENLKEGDKIDVYVSSYASGSWVSCEIVNVKDIECETESSDDHKVKVLVLKKEQNSHDFDDERRLFTIEAHDTKIRSHKSFSDVGTLLHQFQNDECYEFEEMKMFAITRTEGKTRSSKNTDLYLHSKFYITNINMFGLFGGFNLIEDELADEENCTPAKLSLFMSIMANVVPYLLTSFARTTARRIMDLALERIKSFPSEQIRNFANDLIDNTHKALRGVLQYSCNIFTTQNKSESFLLDIAFLLVKSDFLERKLYGLSIISHFQSQLSSREQFVTVKKEDILDRIKGDKLMEGIMKGHPQLITKSADIFKMMFSNDSATEEDLQLLWTTLRKTDIESKQAVMGILNSIYSEFNLANTMYFVDRFLEVGSKNLHVDEIEFIYKATQLCITSNKFTSPEDTKVLINKTIGMLWKISTDPIIKSKEITKKASKKLITSLKYIGEKQHTSDIIIDAIKNVKNGVSVLQSLHILRKVITGNARKSETYKMVQALIEVGIIEEVFNNLHKVKEALQNKIKESGLEGEFITSADIAKLTEGNNHTFENEILKRLKFINFVVFDSAEVPPNDLITEVINRVWEELVVNCLAGEESSYFRQWFIEFSQKVSGSEGSINQSFLSDFFHNKITYLKHHNQNISKNDLLQTFTEIFIRLNMLKGLIEEKVLKKTMSRYSYHYSTDEQIEKYYIAADHPDKLDGIECLWEIAEQTDDEDLGRDIIDFITPFYLLPECDAIEVDRRDIRIYMNNFLGRCGNILESSMKDQGFKEDNNKMRSLTRSLQFLLSVVDESSSRGACQIHDLSSFYRGDPFKLYIDNSIQASYNSPKSFSIQVYRNTTIFDVRKKTADKLKHITWREVKLERKPRYPQLKNKHNGRNLRELEIDIGETLIASQQAAPEVQKAPLVINNEINPKALKAFQESFYRFARSDGFMYADEVCSFVNIVIEEKNSPSSKRVSDFIAEYGDKELNRVSEEQFVGFYVNSSLEERSSRAVRANLKDLGYNPDFSKTNESKLLDKEDMAGWHLSKSSTVVASLLSLLDTEGVTAIMSWQLLTRLPPAESVMKKLLNFEGLTDDVKSWNSLIEFSSPYKTMYYLYIIEFLMTESKEEQQADLREYIEGEHKELELGGFKRRWRTEFIKRRGFDHLLNIMLGFISSGVNSCLEKSLFTFILKIMKNFILASVTIKHPGLYRNIIYIKSRAIPLKVLIDADNSELATESKELNENEHHKNNVDKENHSNSSSQQEVQLTTVGINLMRATLFENEDFKEFRESLKIALGENPIGTFDIQAVLKLLIGLSEQFFTSDNQVESEDITLMEHCLSISMSLLLKNQKLLRKVVLTEDCNLFSEASSLRKEGVSDYLCYFIKGLLTEKSDIIATYFTHAFTVLLRECEDKDIQTILLKTCLDNILDENNFAQDVSRYMSLLCPLLEDVCSEIKDKKILLTQEDLENIGDLEMLFFKVLSFLMDETDYNSLKDSDKTELITGYFNLLQRIISIDPDIREALESKEGIISRIFSECLFNMSTDEQVRCTNTSTRKAAYEFLAEVCKNSVLNANVLLNNGLEQLSKNLPVINSWGYYTPRDTAKSNLGYVGIRNLQCICYMNAMLQQFYMTPAFRYAILAASDYKEEDIVEENGREIDDNLFHQLQKMFAFLDSSERRDYNPKDFCFAFKDYEGNSVNVAIQQDTQEFLNRIFEKLDDTLKPTPFKNITDSVYGGRTCNVFTCGGCGSINKKVEPFYNISLEVKNYKSIEEGFEKFISEDIISDYRCDACGNKCDYSKRCFVKDAPNVMIIHLQRIIFDLEELMNMKINTRYSFPQEMNIKNITLQKYEEELEENIIEKNSFEESTDEEKSKGDSEGKDTPIFAERHDDSYYDYELKGVLIHMGVAEMGHYYSFININRNDPGRPDNNEDKWLEFNDESIRPFNFSDLEAECFGEGSTIEKDEFDFHSIGSRFDKTLNNKNAYILIYEKKEKTPVQFVFTKDNLKEKEKIINTLIKEDHIERIKEIRDEKNEVDIIEVDYYGIKKFVPDNLLSEVKKDNFRFTIEQYVYSFDFLSFLVNSLDFSFIPEFNPKKLRGRIFRGKDKATVEQIELMKRSVNVLFEIITGILTKMNEHPIIPKCINLVMRMVSYNPQLSLFFLTKLEHAYKEVVGLLMTATEDQLREKLSDLLSHIVLVYSSYYKVELSEGKSKRLAGFLNKTLQIFDVKKKSLSYKKLRGFFKFWYSIAKPLDKISIYMISNLDIIRKFTAYFLYKKSTGLDTKSYCFHEKALDPLIKTVAILSSFAIEQSELNTPKIILDSDSYKAVCSYQFLEKILSENYGFNNFKAARIITKAICTNSENISLYFITHCLEKISHSVSDSSIGYLEALKALAIIQDYYTKKRLELIFGFPCYKTSKSGSSIKYGLQASQNLEHQMIEFKCVASLDSSHISSYLDNLASHKEQNKPTGILLLSYLLDMINNSKECFDFILRLPSPFPIYYNYYDFFFTYVDAFVKDDLSYCYHSSLVQQYALHLKESIVYFEDILRR